MQPFATTETVLIVIAMIVIAMIDEISTDDHPDVRLIHTDRARPRHPPMPKSINAFVNSMPSEIR